MGAIQTETLTTGFDLMTDSPLSNVNVTNNFIADAGRSAVWLGNTTGGSVTGNYILAPNARPDLANANPAKLADALQPLVVDATSTGITTASNTIDLTSRRLAVTDAQDRELAAYAPGGVARLSAYNIGTVASPTVTLTDADGNTSPMTVQSSGAHALDVQVPAGAALGGAFVTLTSGSAKYFGTLFLDSQDNIPAVNGCTFQSSVSSMPVSSAASTVPILVVTQAGCGYQVVSKSGFVTAGGGGTGTGVVSVDFAANGGAARTATIEIAGQPVAIPQSAGDRYDRTNRPPGRGHGDNGAADVGSARSGYSGVVRDRSRQQRGREQPRDVRHGQPGDDAHDGSAVGDLLRARTRTERWRNRRPFERGCRQRHRRVLGAIHSGRPDSHRQRVIGAAFVAGGGGCHQLRPRGRLRLGFEQSPRQRHRQRDDARGDGRAGHLLRSDSRRGARVARARRPTRWSWWLRAVRRRSPRLPPAPP